MKQALLLLPALSLALLSLPAQATRLRVLNGAFSFEPPEGFTKAPAPGYLWCGRSASGERISLRLWKRSTKLTTLAPVSSQAVYRQLHGESKVQVVGRGPGSGTQLRGAPASYVRLRRRQYGAPFRTEQVVALRDGNLYVFEYSAPETVADQRDTFTEFLESVRWRGEQTGAPAPAPAATPTKLPNAAK